jgi:hypothetical protein
VGWGDNSSGQTNAPASLTNAMAIAAGDAHSVALRNDGTVVAWGDNAYGQTNAQILLVGVKMIAAGGNHTLAGMFWPLLNYPVDVTKDLLLIYNTNSADSITVLNYYLQHRPMVSSANVLGIGFPGFYVTNNPSTLHFVGITNTTVYETISPADFTNEVMNPVLSWLALNPTKRPEYVLLFQDVPSRMSLAATNAANCPYYENLNIQNSVSFQMASVIPNWEPLITHLNMGGTNECKGYIDKLEYIGTNYSPGKLLIGASDGGYGNTNYYIDDIGIVGNFNYLAGAVTGLVANGTSPSAITYIPSGTDHILSGTNVAGYASEGANGFLGDDYSINGLMHFSGHSGWYILQTLESFNGQRYQTDQANYTKWFATNAFGGVNCANAPVAAVSNVNEPQLGGNNSPQVYFGFWESGKNFAICAWSSRKSAFMLATGDPLVKK